MKHLTIVPLVVLAFTASTRAMAQEQPPPLEPRARTRSGVVLQSGLMLPLTSVTRMDPSPVMPLRRGNAVKTGAIIGAGVGAVAGLVVGVILVCGERERGCANVNQSEGGPYAKAVIAVIAGVGAAAGAGVGALVGVIVAAASGSDSQADAPLDQLRMSVVPQRDGRFGLGLSVRF